MLKGLLSNASSALANFMPSEPCRQQYAAKLFDFAYERCDAMWSIVELTWHSMQCAKGHYLRHITRAAIGVAISDANITTIVAVVDGSVMVMSHL